MCMPRPVCGWVVQASTTHGTTDGGLRTLLASGRPFAGVRVWHVLLLAELGEIPGSTQERTSGEMTCFFSLMVCVRETGRPKDPRVCLAARADVPPAPAQHCWACRVLDR